MNLFLKRYHLLVAILWLTMCGACGVFLDKTNPQSQERYRKSYERSGGFDPISKSVRQNMR